MNATGSAAAENGEIPDDDLLTAVELANKLRTSLRTIRVYTRDGTIPSIRIGGDLYRYRLEDVLAALSSSDPVRRRRAK